MCDHQEWMINYKQLAKPISINSAKVGGAMTAVGRGDIRVRYGEDMFTLYDVLYTPDVKFNLLSVSKSSGLGRRVTFEEKFCVFETLNGEFLLSAKKVDGLYVVRFAPVDDTGMDHANGLIADAKVADEAKLWHHRLCHASIDRIKTMGKGEEYGFTLKGDQQKSFCDACAIGKFSRKPFPHKAVHTATAPLEIVHTDIGGPETPGTSSGQRYYMTITDEFTRFTWVCLLRHKSEAFLRFKEFHVLVTNQQDRKIKVLRSDNGGEYKSADFTAYCKQHGIQQQFTVPYTPQQNGISERWNRTAMERVRTMLTAANFPSSYWGMALQAACYTMNRTPTSALNGKTPYEQWTGSKPDVSNLRVFGSAAYATIPSEKRSKVKGKARRCRMIGYPENSKGYRLEVMEGPNQGKIITSRDAIFDETTVVEKKLNAKADEKERHVNDLEIVQIDEPDWKYVPISLPNGPQTVTTEPKIVNKNVNKPESHLEEKYDTEDDNVTSDDEAVQLEAKTSAPKSSSSLPSQPARHSSRERPPSQILVDQAQGKSVGFACAYLTIKEAVGDKKWRTAMEEELEAHRRHGTWELVENDEKKMRTTVGSKWVYRIKEEPNGNETYKARLVAKGYSQRPGYDYNETFAPVARVTSMRVVLALAISNDMSIDQFDVKTAYLNAPLTEEVFMDPPEGFGMEGKLCKLKKALYGLKQAGHEWNKTLDTFLRSIDLNPTLADACVYVMRQEQRTLILVVYVDDLIIATNDEGMRLKVKESLLKRFDITQKDELQTYVGLQIRRDATSIHISQPSFISELLQKFEMSDCAPQANPYVERPVKHQPGEETIDSTLMRELVGGLLYLANLTRPDIAAPVSALARYQDKPTQAHWRAAKRVLRYLQGTRNLGIQYKSDGDNILRGYADADFAGDKKDRKSTSGMIFILNGGTIQWKSNKQNGVSLSTTESEYISASEAAKEAVHLRILLKELGFQQDDPTEIQEDNQAAIQVSHNQVYHGRLKHVDVRYHHIRHLVRKKQIILVYCDTRHMLADLLTKPLQLDRFCQLRDSLSMVSLS